MILQSLKRLYDRLAEEDNVPPFGFAEGNVDFELVLNRDGELVAIHDIREGEGKKRRSKRMVLPQAPIRPNLISPCFMWDNTGYVLGLDAKDAERARIKFEAFRQFHHQLGDDLDDEAMRALLNFLDNWDPDQTEQTVSRWVDWNEMAGKNVVFRFDGQMEYFHQRPKIRRVWAEYKAHSYEDNPVGICLITGEEGPIARLHPPIKGVRGTNKSGARIVAFKEDAFKSYGKEQGFNAPVSVQAAFEYTTALNYLLSRDSGQNVVIDDLTLVFWAERKTHLETMFGLIISQPTKDTEIDEATQERLRRFWEATAAGKLPAELEKDEDVTFYVLGLAPAASRISVVLWYVSTVEQIWRNLRRHFDLITIESNTKESKLPPTVWQVLRETIPKKSGAHGTKISPVLAGAFMRAILSGTRYPESLLALLTERIRVDGEVNYNRAAMLKGILIKNHNKEVLMSLDPQNTQVPYLLGRLFAVLEAAQRDAGNETIRERYFGAAAATPRRVFPLLLSLTQHHIAKGDWGRYYDKLTGEIINKLPARQFPAHLRLEDQGLFALGYYHQRNALYRGKDEKTEEKSEE